MKWEGGEGGEAVRITGEGRDGGLSRIIVGTRPENIHWYLPSCQPMPCHAVPRRDCWHHCFASLPKVGCHEEA